MARAKAPVRLQESTATPVTERTFSADQRKKMASSGAAMAGGGFPIASEQDLKNAVQAYGRASDKAAAKAHIIKRARALGLTKLLPDGWLDSVSEADRSLMAQWEAVRAAITQKYMPAPGLYPAETAEPCPWVKDIFDSYAIVEKGSELYRIDYTIADDGTITLADPVVVEIAYQPVSEADVSAHLAAASTAADPAQSGAPVEISESATLLEVANPKGSAWRVLLIKAGLSGNRRHYSESVLKAAAPLFEGTQAFADHPSRSELRDRPERSSRDVVGWYEHVAWSDAEQGLVADFYIVESAEWLMKSLKSAWDKGKRDLLGFSINAEGQLKRQTDGSILVESFDTVFSTDVVTKPGAGGGLLGVLESEREGDTDMDPEEIKRLIAEAMATGLTGLQSQLTEALDARVAEIKEASAVAVVDPPKPDDPPDPKPDDPKPDPTAVALREAQGVLAEIKAENRRAAITAKIATAKLPAAHTAKLTSRLLEAASRRDVDDAEIDTEIAYVRELIAESGPARPNWSAGIEQGTTPHEKMKAALQGWFNGAAVDGVTPVRDLRESYSHWTGQPYLDADPYQMFYSLARRYDSGVDHQKLIESLSTADWGQAFADVFYLTMIKRFAADPTYDRWKLIVSDIQSVTDFRTQHFVRIGGYGNFAQVAELQTYPEVTTPGDEEVTYSVTKYGGIESVSMESMLGDRGNMVRRLPMLMAEGAARTLYEFVLDLATTSNPTMDYDSVALYNAAHGNTGTTALSVAGVDAVNIAMRSQTSYGNSVDILGPRNTVKNIIVPNELEGRANRIVNPSQAYQYAIASPADTETVMDPARWADKGLYVHVYDKLTDATDWWATADPNRVATMVIGFLNGRQEPELFTQDQPNVGSMFTADKVQFKLRHVFGGDILEHRSFYRQVVAG